jgi:hypothetical protein
LVIFSLLAPPFVRRGPVKIQPGGNWGARGYPGEGQIHAAKTGPGFSVAGLVFNSLMPRRRFFCFYRSILTLSSLLGGNQESAPWSSISRRVSAA